MNRFRKSLIKPCKTQFHRSKHYLKKKYLPLMIKAVYSSLKKLSICFTDNSSSSIKLLKACQGFSRRLNLRQKITSIQQGEIPNRKQNQPIVTMLFSITHLKRRSNHLREEDLRSNLNSVLLSNNLTLTLDSHETLKSRSLKQRQQINQIKLRVIMKIQLMILLQSKISLIRIQYLSMFIPGILIEGNPCQ